VAGLLALLGVAACGGGGECAAGPSGLDLAPAPVVLYPGDSVGVAAQTVGCSPAPVSGTELVWSVTDPTIAGVSPVGVVHGLRFGHTTLTASGLAGEAQVAVDIVGHPTAHTVEEVHLEGLPYGVAVSPEGVVYVTLQYSRMLARADLPSTQFREVARIGTSPPDQSGAGPIAVRFGPDGHTAWVASLSDALVVDVDSHGDVMGTAIPLGGEAISLAVGPDGLVYAGTYLNGLRVVDPASRSVVNTYLPNVHVGGVAVDTAGSLLFANAGGSLWKHSLVTSASGTFPVGGTPEHIAASPDGREVYIANVGLGSNYCLGVFDVASGASVDCIDVGLGAMYDVAVTPDGTQAFAGSEGGVNVIDLATRQIVGFYLINGFARGIAFDAVGRVAVVTKEANSVLFLR
jgi:streptogramin lyase